MIPINSNRSDDSSEVITAVPKVSEKSSEPKKYAVILHNDDYTTMEFVVEVLTVDFRKSQEEATAIMLKVHNEGKAIAGVYSLEIAETKVMRVMEKARKNKFPLKLTIEEMRAS